MTRPLLATDAAEGSQLAAGQPTERRTLRDRLPHAVNAVVRTSAFYRRALVQSPVVKPLSDAHYKARLARHARNVPTLSDDQRELLAEQSSMLTKFIQTLGVLIAALITGLLIALAPSSLFASQASYGHFDAPHSAARRDLVAPWVQALRRRGLRVGFYYSPLDWRFPAYFHPREMPDNARLLKQQTYGQIEELMRNYGPIDILWYDGGWLAHQGTDADAAWFWEPDKLNRMVRRYQPRIVINPRSGWQGDFEVEEGHAAEPPPRDPRADPVLPEVQRTHHAPPHVPELRLLPGP